MLIVSLSTIPPRFRSIDRTIDSLLAQDVKIDSIELYLPKKYRRFPDWKPTMPALHPSVEIVMVDADLGPATKVLPACARYARQNVDILYCDDDQVYPTSWARSFLDARARFPNEAIAVCGAHVSSLGKHYLKGLRLPRAVKMRTVYDFNYIGRRVTQLLSRGLGLKVPKPRRRHFFRKSGFIDIAAGFGGVLVKPEMFDSIAYNIPPQLWTVDDIWLSGMLARRGIGIWGNSKGFLPIPHEGNSDALQFSVIEGFNRNQADLSCFDYLALEFGVWTD